MNFFLDENFPKSTTTLLHKRGNTVFDIRSTDLEGSDDKVISEIAQERNSIFLTTDKDFFHTIPYLYDQHCGVIIIALRHPNRRSITEKLLFALNNFDLPAFNSKVLLLRDNNFSIIENRD